MRRSQESRRITIWLDDDVQNRVWLNAEIEKSKLSRRAAWEIIEQKKRGEPTGLIAAARKERATP